MISFLSDDFDRGRYLPLFNLLVEKYERQIFMIAYRFTFNYDDAVDIRQEVFKRAWLKIHTLKDENKGGEWMLSIAYNFCKNHKSRNVKFEELDENMSVKESDDKDILRETVAKALLSLPPGQRMAIILLEYEDKKYAEISKSMGITVSAVKSLVFRARESLRKNLSGSEVIKEFL